MDTWKAGAWVKKNVCPAVRTLSLQWVTGMLADRVTKYLADIFLFVHLPSHPHAPSSSWHTSHGETPYSFK